MSKRRNKNKRHAGSLPTPALAAQVQTVQSLLSKMEEGNEYGSIISVVPQPGVNLVQEIIRAMEEIEAIRGRPCIAYLGNVVRRDDGDSGVDSSDDLPFGEMVSAVPKDQRRVDVLLATRGGSAHQISRFVNSLRARFDEVDFIVPSFCMSAGTLFALSGDHIWMTARACLGPIDPQVPTKDGRYVPAQALLLLVDQLQRQGDEAMKNSRPVPWSAVRIIDSIDKKELGDAITASHYSTQMAAQFLMNYKFRHWTVRETSGLPVTPQYREQRATEIAAALASHDRWKNHGHAISREVLWDEIRLRIDHPSQQLERAITRAWALCNWIFDKTPVLKVIVSRNYSYVRYATKMEVHT